jgi:hypothetical protein
MIGCNYNYIKSMIRKNKMYSIIILFSLITMPLMAFGWDVGTSGGAFLSIPGPIQEDAVETLPSASFSINYSPLVVETSPATSISLQLQLTHTTRSQLIGPIYFKDFTTIASGIEFEVNIAKPISVSLALLYSLQIQDDERGSFGFIVAKGSFLIPLTYKETRSALHAIFPVEVEIRSDYTGVRIGAGIRYRYMREKI